jgi:hypothetical protein
MIRNPIDIASRVSPELSSFIETIIDRLESDEPITLGAIRSFISNDMPSEIYETEEMHHFDVEESLVDELDELIDGFGESAAAVDFTSATVSEALSRVIEEVINDENRENVATLGDVRVAILLGLPSRLVGDGVMDEEEDDQLLPEIDSLIERNGATALAEEYLRYE